MKKVLSSIISFILLLSSFPALANEDAKKIEDMLLSIKERIGNTEKYTEFNSNSYKNNFDTFYNFDWNLTSGEDHQYLNVTCNSKGIITSYSTYDSKDSYEDEKLSLNRKKRAEVLKTAQEFIDNINPEIKGTIIVEDTENFESFRADNYRFSLSRYENGYPVLGDTGRITLDKNGRPKSFNFSYTTGLSFESAENIINKDAATIAYNNNLGAKLSYMSYYEKDAKKPSAKLCYTFEHNNKYINAITGDPVEILPYYLFADDLNSKEESAFDTITSAGGTNASLSRAELENIEKIEGLKSPEEIDALIKANRYFGITDDYSIDSSSLYYRANIDKYVYSISYNESGKRSAYLSLDAKTGEILSFTRYNKTYEADMENADIEQIKLLSEEIISEFAGAKAGEFVINDTEENSYHTSFTRYINDIPFYENSVNISFDKDYNLTYYSISYYECDFPSPEGIISKTDIFDIVKDLGNYQVFYVADYENKKFLPVYHLENYYTLDAFTGKSAYEYENTTENTGNYTDISGHWAEEQIKTLKEYGIFFDGTELRPDDAITHKEYAALLSIVFYHNDISCLRNSYSHDAIYRSFPKNFLKEDTLPDAPLTRADAAVLMTRAMGIEEYANLSGIYAPIYTDVFENIGAINILTGLGVLSGNGNGLFNPDSEISRAQALIMIYNYLSR